MNEPAGYCPIPGLRKRFSQTSIYVRAPSCFSAFLTQPMSYRATATIWESLLPQGRVRMRGVKSNTFRR